MGLDNAYVDHCYISYDDRKSADVVNNKLFKCDSAVLNYYEKLPAFRDDSKRCSAGQVSQTGFLPCTPCPADTFANTARTLCSPCPAGTIAFAGADDVRACFLLDRNADGANGAFRLGSEWIGHYSTFIEDNENSTRRTAGGLTLQVVQVDGATVTIIAGFQHGEFCDSSDVWRCRTAGISEFYMSGNVIDRTTLSLAAGEWIGITDRTFNRENLSGSVVVDGANTVFSGTYGGGNFTVTERCSAAAEVGTMDPGDKFIGTYTCERQVSADGRQPLEGEQDVRRLAVLINAVAENGDVTAVFDFDHAEGVGEFVVQGVYDASTRAVRMQPFAGVNAWLTPRPPTVSSFGLVGRLSEDGEFFRGQVNGNAHCECVGRGGVPSTNSNSSTGSACAVWSEYGRSFPWCYVDESCAEAVGEEAPASGYFYARCDRPVCSAAVLTRICSDPSTLCGVGWTAHNARCYRRSAESASYADATRACHALNASLTSVHSYNDNAFVRDLPAAGGESADMPTHTWLGAVRTDDSEGRAGAFAWVDSTPFEYVDWADNAPADNATCVLLDHAQDGRWVTTAPAGNCESAMASYVCRQLPLGRDLSCACNGQYDSNRFGSVCKAWRAGGQAWCYVSRDCPRAVEDSSEGLWWTHCYEGAGATTTQPSTSTAPTTTPDVLLNCRSGEYQAGEVCVPCLVAADCAPRTALTGVCDRFSGPTCAACHSSCANCTGPADNQCTACQSGLLSTADGTRCVSACPTSEFVLPVSGGGASTTCAACSVLCGECNGTSPDQCTACPFGSSLFLSASTCVTKCPDKTFRDESTQVCTPCAVCDPDTQYAAQACAADGDAKCAALTVCLAGREYERIEKTPTSDRSCRALTECRTGQEEGSKPSSVSDRVCLDCHGQTDDDYNWRTPCKSCAAGTYLPRRAKGPCGQFACAAGSADSDQNATTPCVPCPAGFFQSAVGATTCLPAGQCAAGQYPVINATATRDITCGACPVNTYKPTAGNGPCTVARTCDAGERQTEALTSTSDRKCGPCPADTFKATAGNALECTSVSVCQPGEEEFIAASQTADRVCQACESGSFSLGGGAPCMQWTVCQAETSYESKPGSAITDRVCENATVCTEDYYVIRPLTAKLDRRCALLDVCDAPPQEFAAVQPVWDDAIGMYISPRRCEACQECTNVSLTLNTTCTATADAVCTECEPCAVAGVLYEKMGCTAAAHPVCMNCTVCDPASEYEQAPCDVKGDTVCKRLTICTPDVEYEAIAKSSSSDRDCEKVTDCLPGSYVVANNTATTDRSCDSCQPSLTFSSVKNAKECTETTVCAAGEEETSAPTLSTSRKCQPCVQDATFNPDKGAGKCRAVAPACPPGEMQTQPPSLTSNRECQPCDAEMFSPGGLVACKAWQPCGPGKEQDVVPSSSTDRTCSKCGVETFQPATGGDVVCGAKTLCPAGQEEASPGSTSTDRICQPCVVGSTFKSRADIRGEGANSTMCGAACVACQAVRTCASGEEEIAAATVVADRECMMCELGVTFKPAAGSGTTCKPLTECGPGETQLRAPTVSTDRSKCRKEVAERRREMWKGMRLSEKG